MIGFGPEQRRRALDGVDTAHGAPGLGRPPRRRKLPRISEPSGRARDQIAFDAENPIGFAEVEAALDRTAEAYPRRGEFVVAMQRLPLMPAHLRKLLLKFCKLRCKRRRA